MFDLKSLRFSKYSSFLMIQLKLYSVTIPLEYQDL